MNNPGTIWVEPQPVEIPENLVQAVGSHHPIILETLVRKGISTPDQAIPFLHPDKYTPAPPQDLPGIEIAVERIEKAIRNKELIGIWGDFDADGQTSTALLVDALEELGGRTTHYIPIRATESHGVKIPTLNTFLQQGVNLLITCDTGVSEHESIAFASSRNVETIITDHHTLPEQLPEALAVINSQRMPVSHPLHTLCGVGVAYKLIEALYKNTNRPELSRNYLDLVALGTIADVAPLVGENRPLVQQGINMIREGKRLALTTILEIAGADQRYLNEETLGFVLAPRLNALGRLGDANPIVAFLNSSKTSKTRLMATQLEALNSRRKLLSDQVFQASLNMIANNSTLLDDPILVLNHPAWPGGIIGIVANRLANRYQRPVLLISTPQGEIGRGSARSVKGINITSALDKNKNLLEGFGGHTMAAGLSIDPVNIPKLRRGLAATLAESVTDISQPTELLIDSNLPLSEATLDLAEELDHLAPFGPGNPPITFAAHDLMIKNSRTLGRNHEGLLLSIDDPSDTTYKVIWWNGGDYPPPEGKFDLAYTIRANSYRGQKQLQILWKDARQTNTVGLEVSTPELQVIDCRNATEPEKMLEEILSGQDILVWAEGKSPPITAAHDRNSLFPADHLVIWSTPPGSAELKNILETVNPDVLYLFTMPASDDEPQPFLNQLAGRIKYALSQKDGNVNIPDLAAATGHRESTIKLGVQWLINKGSIQLIEASANDMQLASGGAQDNSQLRQINLHLKEDLQETEAFRIFISHVDVRWIRQIVQSE